MRRIVNKKLVPPANLFSAVFLLGRLATVSQGKFAARKEAEARSISSIDRAGCVDSNERNCERENASLSLANQTTLFRSEKGSQENCLT